MAASGDVVAPAAGVTARGSRPSGRARAVTALVGPAVVASVAYVDPGNFATNLQAGARERYSLVWVVVVASAAAMLVQYLAAKLGIATGKNIAVLCGERLGRRARMAFWLQAELVAAATDLAEVLGAALGLHLLLDISLAPAAALAGVGAVALVQVRTRGFRAFELTVGVLLAVIFVALAFVTFRAGPSPSGAVAGLVPGLDGGGARLLALAIVGATVMPHALYVHSDLATDRRPADRRARRRLLVAARIDVLTSLGAATIVNVALLLLAAALLGGQRRGLGIEHADALLRHVAGAGAAVVFSVALLCSGMSSAAVGTYAGQLVMEGLTPWRLPLVVRRAVSVVPAVCLLVAGVSATGVLVLSQVVLAIGLPVVLVPLLVLTSRRQLMHEHANGPLVRLLAGAVIAAIVVLDVAVLATG